MAYQTLEATLPAFSAVGQSADGRLVVLAPVAPTGIPASVSAAHADTANLTAVTGLLSTDVLVAVMKAAAQTGLCVAPGDNAQGGVTGDGAVTIRYINPTAGAITPTAGENYTFVVCRAGTADGVTKLGVVPSVESEGTWLPFKCSLMSPVLVTGQATNYCTFTFRAFTTAGVSRTIATLALSASSKTLPANVEVDVPISAGASLLSGEVLDVAVTQTGTGLLVPPGVFAKVEIG